MFLAICDPLWTAGNAQRWGWCLQISGAQNQYRNPPLDKAPLESGMKHDRGRVCFHVAWWVRSKTMVCSPW
jgi:hypothetical protein